MPSITPIYGIDMIFGKVWGTTEPLLITPFVEIHKIKINPRSFCSKHLHEHKWNAFYLIKGELDIAIEKKTYDLVDVTKLSETNNFTTVSPGEYHWFMSGDNPVECLEIYYINQIDVNDIIRETVGGVIDAEIS